MLAKIASATLVGIHAKLLQVEVDVSSRGLPYTRLVGLPTKLVQESKDRVKSAILNSGFSIPSRKTTINFNPPNLPKTDAVLDLPIALAILQAYSLLPARTDLVCFGELGLDGSVLPTRGALAFAELAKKHRFSTLLFPYNNLPEVSLLRNLKLIPLRTLTEAATYLKTGKTTPLPRLTPEPLPNHPIIFPKNNAIVKRALQIALAGGHHMVISGSPGTGKSMILHTVPFLMLRLPPQAAFETTKLYSAANLLHDHLPILQPPFRTPHHSITRAKFLGGTASPVCELSLAHNGTLFLDELLEFPSQYLESLRRPLELGTFDWSYHGERFSIPCSFTLIGACNPCPCGYRGSSRMKCRCTAAEISRYQHKLSGPFLDRVELLISSEESLPDQGEYEVVEPEYKKMIARAKEYQLKRHRKLTCASQNSRLTIQEVDRICRINSKSEVLLRSAAQTFRLSMRRYLSVLKVARTIADLESQEIISSVHVAEALQYCRPDTFGQKIQT